MEGAVDKKPSASERVGEFASSLAFGAASFAAAAVTSTTEAAMQGGEKVWSTTITVKDTVKHVTSSMSQAALSSYNARLEAKREQEVEEARQKAINDREAQELEEAR